MIYLYNIHWKKRLFKNNKISLLSGENQNKLIIFERLKTFQWDFNKNEKIATVFISETFIQKQDVLINKRQKIA